MKTQLLILTALCSLGFSSAALASPIVTNIALATNGGTAIFGVNSPATISSLGTPYDHSGSTANLNNGDTTGALGGDDTWNIGNFSYVGAEFTLTPGLQVTSLVLYGRDFVDGGWFGLTGYSMDGTPGFDGSTTLAAAALVAPTLQYTTDGGVTWITDAAVTNDYVAQMTGATVGAPTNPATFTLNTPLTGIDGIRLIGTTGGAAGFLGADEIQVFAVPEPSTYALILAGLAFLGFCVRRKSALVK